VRIVSDASTPPRLLARLTRPYRGQILLLLAATTASAAVGAAVPWLVGLTIDAGLPAAVRGDLRPVVGLCAAIAGCALLSGVLTHWWSRRAGDLGQNAVLSLRADLFAQLRRLSVPYHERTSSGQIIATATADADAVTTLFGASLAGLFSATVTIAATVVAMLLLDLPLAELTLCALLPLVVLTVWFVRRRAPLFAEERAASAGATVHVVESLNAIRTVQAYRAEDHNDTLFAAHAERMRSVGARLAVASGIYWPALEFGLALAAIVVLLAGGLRVADGTLQLGVLASFILYTSQFFPPVSALPWALDALQTVLAALARIGRVLDERPDVREPDQPASITGPVRGRVALEGVRFGYRPDRAPEIDELTLCLEPGQVVAMLGATGAGKSTIAKLVARFYDPAEGRVSIDGVDLRDLADSELRAAVTLITQEGFLFSGSIADNIRVGRPDASRTQIEAAAEVVGADTFIRALHDGYDTDVHKRGARLSAGQRQLIAFARAVLVDSPVLILDEATSALDIPTEKTLQTALRTLLRGRTALVIAHRHSTIDIADRVLVVDGGRIIADGVPAELLRTADAAFTALYREPYTRSLSS
jgi:ATP-binding cassette subfamily B protein